MIRYRKTRLQTTDPPSSNSFDVRHALHLLSKRDDSDSSTTTTTTTATTATATPSSTKYLGIGVAIGALFLCFALGFLFYRYRRKKAVEAKVYAERNQQRREQERYYRTVDTDLPLYTEENYADPSLPKYDNVVVTVNGIATPTSIQRPEAAHMHHGSDGDSSTMTHIDLSRIV